MAEDRFKRLAKSIGDFSQTEMTSSEANTKKKIVEPLLEILGWDLLSNEVRLESPVKIGTTTAHVDYALILEDKPVLLVEAKAFDVVLTNEHSSQIISYGRVEGVQWTALTNGKVLKVFDTRKGKSEEECLVFEVNLTRLPEQAVVLKLISRESILTGEIEDAAARLRAARRAIRHLKQRQQELAEGFRTTLLEITGAGIENLVGNISTQLARHVVQLFEKQVEAGSEHGVKGEIPLASRKELARRAPGEVVLCPSRPEGVAFLKKYNAWGFVEMSGLHSPKYFALYVGRPESSVLYFGEIASITHPLRSKEDLQKIGEEDLKTFKTGKRVIHLKPRTLVKLKDPIPLRDRKRAPRGLRYTSLEKLVQAGYVEEL